jgi:protein phosphatase
MQDYGIASVSSNELFQWFIIADGIGGEPNGEIAAQIAVETINEYLSEFNINESTFQTNQFFEDSLIVIQEKFRQLSIKDSSYNNMGCTVCLFILSNQKGYVFWSGDSRLYVYRDNQIYWDTLPHNWSFDLYKKGITTLSEARLSESNYLTASVNGYVNKIRFDSFMFDIKTNDKILICTDGIWNLFEHDELEKEFATKTAKQIQTKLTEYLNKYANDNYLGYVVEFLK